MTPLEHLFTDNEGNQIYIKRDDLLPFSFGGNKIRIAYEFLADMQSQHKDCMIGYGNARSNLSRALSNLCMSKGIECHIISPSDDDGSRIDTFNSLLVQRCGVQFHKCDKGHVAETVAQVMEECEDEGYDPYYIYGDTFGKGNEATPVAAYAKAYQEIQTQLAEMHTTIDYLFLATGTGMTQSGLIAGKKRAGGTETIVGISVARSQENETRVMQTYLESYAKREPFTFRDEDILIDDSYLCGGYGKYDHTVEHTIEMMYTRYGLPLDPTYSGKAFTGMLDYLSKHGIKGKNILFLHTGGTPLFFDYLKKRRENMAIEIVTDPEEVERFLARVDQTLPTPLSQRVDLAAYAQKILTHGNMFAIREDDALAAGVLFYTNDSISKRAFITLIATDPASEHAGYGSTLLKAAEDAAVRAGMQYMTLETSFSNDRAIAFYAKRGYKVEFADQKLHMIKTLA